MTNLNRIDITALSRSIVAYVETQPNAASLWRKPTKADAIRRALQAGMSLKRAAERSSATMNYVLSVATKLGYHTRGRQRRPKNEALRQAIIEGYANHLSPREIAAQCGSTEGSVKVLAYKLGVSRRPIEARAIWMARHAIPEHLAADYQNLTKRKGYTAAEARAMLGITAP